MPRRDAMACAASVLPVPGGPCRFNAALGEGSIARRPQSSYIRVRRRTASTAVRSWSATPAGSTNCAKSNCGCCGAVAMVGAGLVRGALRAVATWGCRANPLASRGPARRRGRTGRPGPGSRWRCPPRSGSGGRPRPAGRRRDRPARGRSRGPGPAVRWPGWRVPAPRSRSRRRTTRPRVGPAVAIAGIAARPVGSSARRTVRRPGRWSTRQDGWSSPRSPIGRPARPGARMPYLALVDEGCGCCGPCAGPCPVGALLAG